MDLSQGPTGGIASMILADFGAEVLCIERPGGNALDQLPAAPMWRRGKRRLTLDLNQTTDLAILDDLCGGADVLLCNWRASALARKMLDFDSLHSRHPHLIYCHISGYGSRGPRADYPGYEHLVAASSGRMKMFSGLVDRPGPVFSALQVAVHACAQSAATGILAALLERGDDGSGRLVETSLLRAMLPYELAAVIGCQFPERFGDFIPATAPAVIEPPIPSLFYHPAQTADGRWLQFGNLLPHLFDNFLLVTELVDVLADPDYDPQQMLLPGAKQEAFRERMLLRIQQRSAEQWMSDCIANAGVVATELQTTQQALTDPDIVANGHVISAGGGSQLGPLAKLLQTPAAPGPAIIDDSSESHEHNAGNSWADHWRSTPRAAPSRARSDALPLEGIRVIEIATIIAAPLGASFLADLGADVIKVEPIGGDPFRGNIAGIGAARVNCGKRSLCIDLKSAQGQSIVLNLLADADVLIHNFRPGVPERLGIGYSQVQARNPAIIYLQSNGYGPDGPGALRPSTHPVPGAAMGAVLFQMAQRVPSELLAIDDLRNWTQRLMHANDINPDPNTALVIATSVMLALVARVRTGRGQQVLVDMFGANAYANSDDFLSYPGKPPRALADPQLLGLSDNYRLYSCQQGWIFLALVNERDMHRFVDTLTEAGFTSPSIAQLLAGNSAAALQPLFNQRSSLFWEQLLASKGIGCVNADTTPREFWLEQQQQNDYTAAVEHPVWGPYRRHGSQLEFDRGNHPLGPPPLAGQHNKELLQALGLHTEQITALENDGVLWSELT